MRSWWAAAGSDLPPRCARGNQFRPPRGAASPAAAGSRHSADSRKRGHAPSQIERRRNMMRSCWRLPACAVWVWSTRSRKFFTADQMCPAAGQGALAIQTRENDPVGEICGALNHLPTSRAVACERAALAALDGGLPIARWRIRGAARCLAARDRRRHFPRRISTLKSGTAVR